MRQHQDYYREVNHVAIEGPTTQTKWSHIPITFSAHDVNLALFPHTDAMVLTIHIIDVMFQESSSTTATRQKYFFCRP
jgi:hypothetical protein